MLVLDYDMYGWDKDLVCRHTKYLLGNIEVFCIRIYLQNLG